MARVYQPLTWWTERDEQGHMWPIILTSDDLTPQIATREPGNKVILGITLRNERVIYMWAGQTLAELHENTLHELMHLSCEYQRRLTLAAEEHAVTVISPRLLPILRRNGLSLPPLPPGWRGLQRHAWWVRYGREQWLADID